MNFSSKIEKTFNWLDAERAARIIEIAKRHDADSVKRLAQQRGALGQCKVLVTFNRHSWAASLEAMKPFNADIASSGLVDSLTYQNS